MVFFKITVLESFKRSLRNLNDEGESSWVKIDYTNLAFTHFPKFLPQLLPTNSLRRNFTMNIFMRIFDFDQSSCIVRHYSYKSSCSQMLFKIGVYKKLANFTGSWSLFLIKLQALKRDSDIVAFL